MTYSQFNSIEASDYNTLVGGEPTVSANSLNAVWGTGGGKYGYGQPAVANILSGTTVTDTNWDTLVSTISSAGSHQGVILNTMVPPDPGNLISVINGVQTNLNTLYSSALDCRAQGTTSNSSVTVGTTWVNFALFTHTVTFANANAARYFFNAGGQIALTPSHPNGSEINNLVYQMAQDFGTMVLSSPNSGTMRVGTPLSLAGAATYNGVTKIGGGGAANRVSVSPNYGYYGLQTSNVTLMTQLANTASNPANYRNSFISVQAKTNGTQGSNGDNGTVITIYTTFDEVPGTGRGSPPQLQPTGLVVSAGTNVDISIRYPSTDYIANTWGTVTVSGTSSTA